LTDEDATCGPGPAASGYRHGACLQHWWWPGLDPEDLGRDFGLAAHAIDIDLDAPPFWTDQRRIGGDASGPFIELDGLFGYLANERSLPRGMGNEWTLAIWLEPQDLMDQWVRPEQTLFRSRPSDGTNNGISASILSDLPGAPLRVSIADRDGALLKDYLFPDLLEEGSWAQLVVTWDGDKLEIWINGTAQTPSLRNIDRPTRAPDGSRTTGMSPSGTFDTYVGGGPDATQFEGNIGAVALWRKTLGESEIKEIYQGGRRDFDLRSGDSGICE